MDHPVTIDPDSPRIDRFMSPSRVKSLKSAGVKKMTFRSVYMPKSKGIGHILYMIRFSRQGVHRHFTGDDILLDSCGNVHSAMHREAARDIYDNPDSGEVSTMAYFTPKQVCIIPFIEDALFNDTEDYAVFSQIELMRDDNVWVKDI